MTKQKRIQKNLALSAEFNAYLFRDPNMMEKLPNNVCIVFEARNDKVFTRANLKTAEELPNPKKCVVASKSGTRWSIRPLLNV